jgi:hypothetical protein
MKKTWQQVEGWFHATEVYKLQQLAKDKICLELGSYKGKSTVALADVANKVYSVDPFKANGGGQWQLQEYTTLDENKENIQGYNNI